MEFKSLNIIEPILRSLEQEGYRTPTPIQAEAIPIILSGRDFLGVAQTGTGKTAAFSIPIIQELSARTVHGKKRLVRSLVITPTRELAIQVDESMRRYGRHVGLHSAVIFGGVSQGKQTSALQKGTDIVVGTPGRLLDLMHQGYLSLKNVEILVLDEADRMLDMGFLPDVKKILHEIPKHRQSLFFSATMPPPIAKLADSILHDPVKVEIEPETMTVDLIKQMLYHVKKQNKLGLLVKLLDEKDIRSALVFTRTKHGADIVVRELGKNRISAQAIHSSKSQNFRQRALTDFKRGKLRVLVATDIAARGIDIDELQFVINYEIPNIPETYVHRIGRTGRAGLSGTAISFCSDDERPHLSEIQKLIGKRIPVAEGYSSAEADSAPVKHGAFHQPKTSHTGGTAPEPARKVFHGRRRRR